MRAPRRFRLRALALGAAFASVSASALADTAPRLHARWTDHSALTTRPNRLETAIFSHWGWGISERVELQSHPLLSVVYPHLAGKVQLWDDGTLFLSSRHELASPTPLLRTLARPGAFGLLPEHTPIPWIVLFENSLLFSVRLAEDTWLTLDGGGVVAIGKQSKEGALDFPFLYQRLVSVAGGATLTGGLTLGGSFANGRFGYEVRGQLWNLPVPEPGLQIATEGSAQLDWYLSDSHRLELGARGEATEFPIGWRVHWFPTVDYGFAW